MHPSGSPSSTTFSKKSLARRDADLPDVLAVITQEAADEGSGVSRTSQIAAVMIL
jgi:hypothetical protein